MKKISIYKDNTNDDFNLKLLVNEKSLYLYQITVEESTLELIYRCIQYTKDRFNMNPDRMEDIKMLERFGNQLIDSASKLRKEHYQAVLEEFKNLPF